MDPVSELKIRAEILHKRLASGSADAIERLRALPEMRRADERALAAMASDARRKHCLAIVARECGFSSWEHAHRVLDGDPHEADFGTLLHGEGASAILKAWFAKYEEARAFLDEASLDGTRRYLLVYRRDFFVADRHFIATLGLDPDDADWQAIDWSWPRPRDPIARRRLYQKRLTALRGER